MYRLTISQHVTTENTVIKGDNYGIICKYQHLVKKMSPKYGVAGEIYERK